LGSSGVRLDNGAVPTTVEVYRVESDNTTGPFLGFGSLLDPAVIFLHPSATVPKPSGPVQPEPDGPEVRARCRIRTDAALLTIDGKILPAPAEVSGTAPVAVALDVAYAGDIDDVEVSQGPGHPTADEAAEAVLAFVTEAARNDPPTPTAPPPVGPDVDSYRPHPGRRPWYCVICPGAFGC
jgi:hypothetical protein